MFRIRGACQEVSCEAPCALQVIDRCTGEVYAELQPQIRAPLESIVEHFNRSGRHCMTDSDGAVLRGERAWKVMGPRRLQTQGFCRLRRISKIATRGVDEMLHDGVSSITHIALVLQTATAMMGAQEVPPTSLVQQTRLVPRTPQLRS